MSFKFWEVKIWKMSEDGKKCSLIFETIARYGSSVDLCLLISTRRIMAHAWLCCFRQCSYYLYILIRPYFVTYLGRWVTDRGSYDKVCRTLYLCEPLLNAVLIGAITADYIGTCCLSIRVPSSFPFLFILSHHLHAKLSLGLGSCMPPSLSPPLCIRLQY